MVSRRVSDPEQQPSRRQPAKTPEGRENQLVSMAVDLAEKQLRNGTASAQVISHYLKMGSMREQLERERLMHENRLLQVKAEQLASAKVAEELYVRALDAMRAYSGQEPTHGGEDYED